VDGRRKTTVRLVQQGVWDMPLESMPLAAGYLKAMALADPCVRERADIEIVNFRGGATHVQMAAELFGAGAPDVLAFSALGWNVRAFGSLAATFKQLKPDGVVIVGGTHVSHQAARVFRMFPDIDVVVNGEGELTFQQLLRTLLSGASAHELAEVVGVSWRTAGGEIITNRDRDRIEDLDIIPSPFLTGVVELTDATGTFRYDVALLETNRGCPYKCSFCYWGGAVGQRVRAFSRARLREELEVFAKLQVHTIVACDANFGMLPIDAEFIDDLIETKRAYGFPRAFEASWAKNKSKTFYDIVHRMKTAKLRGSFTLALQSLSTDAIDTMNRRNMRLNEWRDLAQWLAEEGLDCYAELIWGVPGETVESFLHGYDELSRLVSRIAVYPMMLLPNTEYEVNKNRYGIVSVRGDQDDFEYVLAHQSMSFDDDARVARFLFWARVLAENAVLRHIWRPLRELAGLTQSQTLNSFVDWVETTTEPTAAPLRSASVRASGGGAPAFARVIGYLFTRAEGDHALRRWWSGAIQPQLGADVRGLLDEIFRYDLLTKPVCPGAGGTNGVSGELSIVEIDGERYYLRRDVRLSHDVPAALDALRAGRRPSREVSPITVDLYYRTGALNAVASTNHEEIVHFMGARRGPGGAWLT
jgi:radical SAM C-methyltransferase